VAVKSPLRPSSIVSENVVEPAKLGNFITGGSPLGESVLSSAANKIVGFQRGTTGVAARPPDLGSIINTLSSSILSNVENRVQSINQNITQVVQNRLGFYDKELKERLDKTESAKPSGILANFLKSYKQAIEYIQFLGNRKNIKTLGENIKELQNVFTETFEVAKIIRQTIVKIVKQLSNLPTASSTGGGLNLDINIPGGPLKRTLPRGLANFGKMALAGGAIAGAGMLGGKVVSGMMDVGEGQVQPVVGEGSEGLSGPILDRFSAILDRFSAAIDSLSKKPTPSIGGGSGGSPAAPSTEPSSPSSPGAPGGSSAVSSAPGDEKLAAFVASMEASSPENAADAMQVMLNRSASGKYGEGLSGVLSGYDQFSPISAAIFGKSKDKRAERIYGPIAARLPGKTPQEKFQYLQQVAAEPDGLNKLQQIFGGGSSSVSGTILNDPKYLEMSRQNVKGALNFYGGKKQQASDLQVRPGGNIFYNFTGPIGTLSGKPTATTKPPSTVAAAPTQAETAQQVSQTVSQQPGANQPSKSLVVPVNLGGAGEQTQPNPPAPPAPPPVLNQTGTQVRNVVPTNFDNFYTTHSRLTFNIV
jgi:hypothetical protein